MDGIGVRGFALQVAGRYLPAMLARSFSRSRLLFSVTFWRVCGTIFFPLPLFVRIPRTHFPALSDWAVSAISFHNTAVRIALNRCHCFQNSFYNERALSLWGCFAVTVTAICPETAVRRDDRDGFFESEEYPEGRHAVVAGTESMRESCTRKGVTTSE